MVIWGYSRKLWEITKILYMVRNYNVCILVIQQLVNRNYSWLLPYCVGMFLNNMEPHGCTMMAECVHGLAV